jgi:hypothetical protein
MRISIEASINENFVPVNVNQIVYKFRLIEWKLSFVGIVLPLTPWKPPLLCIMYSFCCVLCTSFGVFDRD